MKQISAILLGIAMSTSPLTAGENSILYDENNDYRPMLEVGKEWRYTLHDCAVFTDDFEPDLKRIYRIDGIENVNGKDFYIMNTYTGDAQTPDGNTPYGYFREDIAEKKVYFLDNFDYDAAPMETWLLMKRYQKEEYLLYDFIGGESQCVANELNVCGNVYPGFRYESESIDDSYPRYGFFEGLGLVGYPDEKNGVMGSGMYDILGFCRVPMGESARYFPFLYEIADGDGTILYQNDLNRPASLEIATENPAISEPAEYFTLQGVKVSGEPATAGIYLRKAGNAVSKVLVK